MSKGKIHDEIAEDLQDLLSEADSHEDKVEILLLAILRELKTPGANGGGP